MTSFTNSAQANWFASGSHMLSPQNDRQVRWKLLRSQLHDLWMAS